MDIVLAIFLLIVGTAMGFVASRFLSASVKDNQKLSERVSSSETALAQYKLDVAEHLDDSTKLLDKMNSTCQTAMKQMEKSTQLLKQATPLEVDGMPFFSKETQEQLAQTVSLRHSKAERKNEESGTEPPRDYSDQASGLFADKKQSVTNVG
ncbi:MAG: uncharacterized membrane-anchored protein YhcB (DUF1043 family) [Colwellia sp.]|jgi:uncharacterized membrane-anchored protein YhcB (DUF1043 family)